MALRRLRLLNLGARAVFCLKKKKHKKLGKCVQQPISLETAFKCPSEKWLLRGQLDKVNSDRLNMGLVQGTRWS